MLLYTYEDADGNIVGRMLATANFSQATDTAARHRWKVVENTVKVTGSELVADFTPEDESDG